MGSHKNRKSQKNQTSKKPSNEPKVTKGEQGKKEAKLAYEVSKLQKELAAKDSSIESIRKDLENEKLSKENIQLKFESLKKENNPLVIIDDKDSYENEIDKIFLTKELDAQLIHQIKTAKIEIIEAETNATIRIIEAESNSPEARREAYKQQQRITFNKLLAIFGFILTLVGVYLLYLAFYLVAAFLGTLGLALLAIGIAHFNSSEDLDTAKKILELFPKFPKFKKDE